MEAAYLLGGALSDQNRADEAVAAFRVARGLPGSDRLRASVATSEAGVLSHQLGRVAEAERVLDQTSEILSDPRATAVLEGGRAAILVSRGFDRQDLPGLLTGSTPTGALAKFIHHATAGRLDDAIGIATGQLATASDWTEEFPTIELYLQLARTWALMLSGRLIEAQTAADAAYRTAVEEHAEFPRLTWSFVRGMILVARGLPRSATRALREAGAGFEVADRGFLRPTRTYLAMAGALAGDADASEQHLQAAHNAMTSYEALFAVDLARAAAWVSAARGEQSMAAEQAQQAADDAAARNAYALEILALHDVARFGCPVDVADRLDALTELVDGGLVRSTAAHARALADRDGPALDAVSHSFQALTLELFAAEASAAASRAHRAAGLRASAFAARERANDLVARCESAQTPTLTWGDRPEALTAREREIADLARSDLPSREIGERLGITTRTVDNLLGRAYAKLGVSGRKELAELLGRRPTR
jgi:DNA-binding CsgD family transcriptional regulator